MLKFCKNLVGPCLPLPTYLPTYLPYLWETKLLHFGQMAVGLRPTIKQAPCAGHTFIFDGFSRTEARVRPERAHLPVVRVHRDH